MVRHKSIETGSSQFAGPRTILIKIHTDTDPVLLSKRNPKRRIHRNRRRTKPVGQKIGPLITVNRRHAIRPRIRDRKSTRLNSSHVAISYAVFCLKKKKELY